MSNNFKYRGFLSYSHQDKAFGEWLHKRIENFKVPRDLVGKAGERGPVPAKLRPVFRDRLDLEAGHSLTEKIGEALRKSEALIVMCSPGSARSEAVNEEIRMYKAEGRERHIFPIFVEDSTGSTDEECFPPMLSAVLDANGQPTGEVLEPIAADARPDGDGKDIAALKIISGLLGVDLDELRRREELARRRQVRNQRIIATVMTLLAIVAALGWVQASQAKGEAIQAQQRAEAARAEAEQRYEHALNETLRLVITKASYETKLNPGQSFRVSQVEVKGADNSFINFLEQDRRGSDYVFHRMTEVLLEFAEYPPQELQNFDLKKDWLNHADLILTNLLQGDSENQGYLSTKAKVEEALAGLN